MSINSYKLVPLKMFEDLLKNRQDSLENNRSIGSIIEDSQNDNSNEHSRERFSTPSGPQMTMGGSKERSSPLWVYEDQSILPDYSQGKKLTESFESYKNMLDDNTLPENIKIHLLQFLKDKYNKTREPYGAFEGDEDEDEPSDKIIHTIMYPMGPEKRKMVLSIVRIFRNNANLIKWNSEGDFVLPNYVDNLSINLNSLLRILVYANVGSNQEIESAIEIIKPFYKSIKNFIVNKKLIRRIENFRNNTTKKYVALNSKKKSLTNKKKKISQK